MQDILRRNDLGNPYKLLSLPELRDRRKRIAAELDDVKKLAREVDEAIESKVREEVDSSRRYHQKPDGTIKVVVQGVEVKSTLPKRVEWDSSLLDEIITELELTGENPMEWVEYKLSIPEKTYKSMPAKIRGLVDRARTTKHGKEKIELEGE